MEHGPDKPARPRDTGSVSILLAEPNLLLKEKIAGILARHDDVWCVVQVSRKLELVRGAARISPDFVLIDLALLKDQDTIKLVRMLCERAKIFALVDASSDPYSRLVRHLGLDGLIEKSAVAEKMTVEISRHFAAKAASDD